MSYKLMIALVIVLGSFSKQLYAQGSSLISSADWEEDLAFLVTKMSKMSKIVPDFKLKVDQKQLDSLVQNLKSKLEHYSENQIVIALQEILNQVQDEGCRIYPFQARLNYKVLPLRTYWFEEGIYICDASEKYKSLKEERITAINGVPIDSVYAKLAQSLNADNPHYKQYLFPLYSSIPAWLVGKNLGQHKNHVTLSLASGKETTVFAEEVAEYAKLNRNLAGYKRNQH